jgi:hypothetical protein
MPTVEMGYLHQGDAMIISPELSEISKEVAERAAQNDFKEESGVWDGFRLGVKYCAQLYKETKENNNEQK